MVKKRPALRHFFINEKIDEGGAIILQHRLEIGSAENAGSLHDRMMLAGNALINETLQQIIDRKQQLEFRNRPALTSCA